MQAQDRVIDHVHALQGNTHLLIAIAAMAIDATAAAAVAQAQLAAVFVTVIKISRMCYTWEGIMRT